MMNLGRTARTHIEACAWPTTARPSSRTRAEYSVYDADGTKVGWLVRPVGIPAFGVNAPAVLLRRAL
jgi:hypothetical protein